MGKQRTRTRVRLLPQEDGSVREEAIDAPPPSRLWLWISLAGVAAVIGVLWLGLRRAQPAKHDPGPPPPGMVWIPPGKFWMGLPDDPHCPDASPQHEVSMSGFWIDATEVTNAEFAKFVAATNYRTVAEQLPVMSEGGDVPPEWLKPSSNVFLPPTTNRNSSNPIHFWRYVAGADWRHPTGPDSSIEGKDDYPVVHVSWFDAVIYAEWAGKKLPTEAQWEYAARGGLDRARFVWGSELKPGGKWMANVWQGMFPIEDTGEDGFRGLAPVKSFPPNGYGVYDMAGNVWEWCQDWYRPDYYSQSPAQDPNGPVSSQETLLAPTSRRVQRGGSFLTPYGNQRGFQPGARNRGDPVSPSNHVGFRCVKTP